MVKLGGLEGNETARRAKPQAKGREELEVYIAALSAKDFLEGLHRLLLEATHFSFLHF